MDEQQQYLWYYIVNGEKIYFESTSDTLDITEFESTLTEPVKIYCEYDGMTREFLLNGKEPLNATIDFIGTDLYVYDINGNMELSAANYDKTIQPDIKWIGNARSYELVWYVGDQKITSEKYSPDNSMLKEIWLEIIRDDETEKILKEIIHYKIYNSYVKTKVNNIITLKILLEDGSSYDYEKVINFTKDGDTAINGKGRILFIKPINDGNPLIINEEYHLEAEIYQNGIQVPNQSLQWSLWGLDKNGNEISINDDKNKIRYDEDSHEMFLSFGQLLTWNLLDNDPAEDLTDDDFFTLWSSEDEPSNEILNRFKNNNLSYSLQDDQYFEEKSKNLIIIKDDSAQKLIIKRGQIDLPSYYYLKCSDIIGKIDAYYPLDVNQSIDSEKEKLIIDNNIVQYSSFGTSPSIEKIKLSSIYTYYFLIDNQHCNIQADNQIYLPEFINKWQVFGAVYNDNHQAVRTIMLYIDRYSNSNINAWDGTKIKINEDENYILAAQIGAGFKEDDNSFTGIVMGTIQGKNENNEIIDRTGLFGYNKGVNTFGLNSDGTAFFGAGQLIQIDGTSATIKGNDQRGSYSMSLNLMGKADDIAIEVGSDFKVNYDGELYAKSGFLGYKGNNPAWEITEDGLIGYGIGQNQDIPGSVKLKPNSLEFFVGDNGSGSYGSMAQIAFSDNIIDRLPVSDGGMYGGLDGLGIASPIGIIIAAGSLLRFISISGIEIRAPYIKFNGELLHGSV